MSNHGRTRSKSALVITLGLFISTTPFANPAYGVEVGPSTKQNIVSIESAQTLEATTSSALVSTLASRDSFSINLAVASVSAVPQRNVPVSYIGGGLLGAARAQLGIGQDCTAMVENALRMVGYSVGDVGPMGFASFGVSIDPSEAQPGDIMMRSGHVAIYAGNGTAVHGGFNGTTAESARDSDPYSYALIVRVQ